MVLQKNHKAGDAPPGWAGPAVTLRGAGSGRSAQIVEQIRRLIEAERLSPGDRLPSERQLAARFGASRGSVRQAIQYLTIMGLLEIRHGGGSYLQAAPETGNARDRWRQWVRDHRGRVLETLEVRLGMEAFAAGLAARRAGPEDLERIVFAIQAMRQVCAAEPVDTARFVECDIAFHDALLQASGNNILRELILALGDELLPERAAVTVLKGRTLQTYNEHLQIFEAVRSGDIEGAAEAMRRHVMSVRRDVLVRVLENDRLQRVEASAAGPKRSSQKEGMRSR